MIVYQAWLIGPPLKWSFVVHCQRFLRIILQLFQDNFTYTELIVSKGEKWRDPWKLMKTHSLSQAEQAFSDVRRPRLEPIAIRNHMPKSPRSQPHQPCRSVLATRNKICRQNVWNRLLWKYSPVVFKIGAIMFILTCHIENLNKFSRAQAKIFKTSYYLKNLVKVFIF